MRMVRAFGKAKAAVMMADYSEEYRDTKCDGSDRWVQILRVPNAGGHELGDGYILCSLDERSHMHSWTLPSGAQIEDVSIVGDQLVFRVFGNISQGSYKYEIPADAPKEFCLEWPAGSPVPQQWIGALMSDEYCVPENHESSFRLFED
ncbi:MAG TPA: hypothetical protein DDW52_13950 [Planctomycetaceae bacterium]|nr:hypothetical protein [Planctomycetaceae bacterium]